MKHLNKYICEALNVNNISKEELNTFYKEFKSKYKIDLSKKNLSFFDLFKDFTGNKSYEQHLWITFMNDPENKFKHIEPYFCGIEYNKKYVDNSVNIKFIEFRTGSEVSSFIKKRFIKYKDEIIKTLNIKVLSDENIIKFINSFKEKKTINEGALTNRRENINNLSKKIEKLYNLLQTLWENKIEFHIEEYHKDKLSSGNIIKKINKFYNDHYKDIQLIYKQDNIELPPNLDDIEDEELWEELCAIVMSTMYNNDLLSSTNEYIEIIFDSSIMKSMDDLYDYINTLKKGINSKDYELSIINFKELEDIIRKQKEKKYFYIYNNKCSISFNSLLNNIDEIINIII